MLKNINEYNKLIYHIKQANNILKKLNANDLTIISELLRIEQSKRNIAQVYKYVS